MRPVRPFDKITRSKKFDKDLKKLPRPILDDAKNALKEIQKLSKAGGEMPASRNCKIRKGNSSPDIWQIRIKGQFRITFHYQDTTIVFRRAAAHRTINKFP